MYHAFLIHSFTGETNQQNKEANMLNITRDIEIRHKVTVTRGEVRADNREKRGNYCQKYVQTTHGQNQTGVESGVGSGDG